MSAVNAVANDNQANSHGRIGAPLYKDQWPNRKVARVASMAAMGYSSTVIASILADGSTGNQVAHMIHHWGIRPKSSDPRKTYADVAVPLCAKHRTILALEAERRGMDLPELIARMAETICRDGLFGAVLDG